MSFLLRAAKFIFYGYFVLYALFHLLIFINPAAVSYMIFMNLGSFGSIFFTFLKFIKILKIDLCGGS